MSMMMRVTVIRGGRRVRRWCRRLQCRSVDPGALVPTAQVAQAVGTQVRQLDAEVRDGVRELPESGRPGRMRRLAQMLVERAAWWWHRVRWRLQCPAWLLGFTVDEVRRCRQLWRRLRVGMLIRRVQRKRWQADWRTAAHALRCRDGPLTSPCS